MVVLVLDPAESTGYCLVQLDGDSATIYEYGLINIAPHDYEGDRCIDLMNKVDQLITQHHVSHIVVEDYFFSRRFAKGCDMNMAYRTAIHILSRQRNLDYTILNISQWKKFIAGRTTPTREQKDKWGKAPAKKLMIQQALWEKYGFRFPNHSISEKTGKPIKFRFDIVDVVAQAVCYCRLYLDLRNVQLSVPVPEDVKIKSGKATFIYE